MNAFVYLYLKFIVNFDIVKLYYMCFFQTKILHFFVTVHYTCLLARIQRNICMSCDPIFLKKNWTIFIHSFSIIPFPSTTFASIIEFLSYHWASMFRSNRIWSSVHMLWCPYCVVTYKLHNLTTKGPKVNMSSTQWFPKKKSNFI